MIEKAGFIKKVLHYKDEGKNPDLQDEFEKWIKKTWNLERNPIMPKPLIIVNDGKSDSAQLVKNIQKAWTWRFRHTELYTTAEPGEKDVKSSPNFISHTKFEEMLNEDEVATWSKEDGNILALSKTRLTGCQAFPEIICLLNLSLDLAEQLNKHIDANVVGFVKNKDEDIKQFADVTFDSEDDVLKWLNKT